MDNSEDSDDDLVDDAAMTAHAENRVSLNLKNLSASPAKHCGSPVKG